ncbi:MAG: sulfatase [Deltaproteobacteria bacterium]|nr:sulfatase [Deltaproteobacteria bacterium]
MASLPACHSCAPSLPLRRHNVVLIVVDTLRADHLGCYGYGRPVSPAIDALAANGVLFAQSRSISSYTRESIAALFTGALPSRSGASGWNATPGDHTAVLAARLQSSGYHTAFVTNTNLLTDPGFTRGFEIVRQLESAWGVSRTSGRVASAALDAVTQLAPGPFFLYAHFLDPHAPYDPPADLRSRFVTHRDAPEVEVYRDLRPQLGLFLQQGFGPGEARYEQMVSRYDAEIADTDRAIAALLAGLERLGLRNDTLVILTADHGEEFLEHGFIEHAWTLYDESVRVPLIFAAPETLPRGSRSQRQASTVDVATTVLALLGLDPDAASGDGNALFEPSGILAPDKGQHPYVGELRVAQRNVVRALASGRWKYLAAQRWLAPDERTAAVQDQDSRAAEAIAPNAPLVREELYDLDSDPGEHHDLAPQSPPILETMRKQLASWAAAVASTTPPPTINAADRERLRALGYVE